MSIRQKKAINELVAKGGSIASAMRKAGYSARTARTPKKLTETKAYKKEVIPFIQKLEKEREAAINAMKKKRGRAKYRDLTDSVDKLTKNIELLSGRPTSRDDIVLSDDEKGELDNILQANAQK